MASPSKIQAVVSNINRFGDSVYEYTFKPKRRIPRFKPGQFLHLALDPYDPSYQWPDSRVFSIATGNNNNEELKIVISVKGVFTTRMANELLVGSECWLKLPYGDFIIDTDDKQIVLIAGGTGVAPFISFLESNLQSSANKVITLYYGVKDIEVLLFEDQFINCKKQLNDFDYSIYIESLSDNDKPYFTGRINIEQIFNQHKGNAVYYLSGPWVMIEKFKEFLIAKDIIEQNIRIDEW